MLTRRTVQLLPLPAYVCGCLLTVAAFAHAQTPKDNYDVSISLFRPVDEAEVATRQPLFSFAAITVPPGIRSVQDLLLDSQVYADSDSIGLMLALNPDLREPLEPGSQVRVLQIPRTPEITKALSEGFLFKVTYDARIIRDIVSSRESLRRLTQAASALTPERFADSALRPAASDCVSSISGDFDQIANHLEDREQPTNHEVLSQVRGEVDLLKLTLSRVTQETATVTPADKNVICAVAKDLRVKQEGFENTRGSQSTLLKWPQARVLVNTIDAVTHQPVPNLTVYYAPIALEDDARFTQPFAGLSSPAESPPLAEGDYVFWVAKDIGRSPLSTRKPVQVRKTEDSKPLIVDILVKR